MIENSDLKLAWKRIKYDEKRNVFIKNSLGISVFEKSLEDNFRNLLEKLNSGQFEPISCQICNVPKPNYLLRPGTYLDLEDRLVYYAITGKCLNKIYDGVKWAQGRIDYSCQINEKSAETNWINSPFNGWKKFADNSLKKLNSNEYPYIIITDIAGYYENINIYLLMSDLRYLNINETYIQIYQKILKKWCQVNERGIPQGYTPSDILGKVYLNNLDMDLNNRDIAHLRYVDDIRIFCKSMSDAKRNIEILSSVLRERGLILQSAKTKIFNNEEAKTEFLGVQPILGKALEKYKSDILKELQLEYPYITLNDADDFVKDMPPENTPLKVIRDAYFVNIINSNGNNFDKTLFRFLLKRLGNGGDIFAIESCIQQLTYHAEETNAILKYLESVDSIISNEDKLTEFLLSGDFVYDYQVYLILQCLTNNLSKANESLLRFVRRIVFESDSPAYLKSMGCKFLGEFGNSSDLERLLSSYRDDDNVNTRIDIICSLRRMEKSKRNSFFGRINRTNPFIKNAILMTRTE